MKISVQLLRFYHGFSDRQHGKVETLKLIEIMRSMEDNWGAAL